MPYRRSFKRPPRRSFRRGVKLREPREPYRWEVGNIVIEQPYLLSAETDLVQTAVVSVAQIPFHVGDVSTGQGRALNQYARFLEIGGIVFRYHITDEAPSFGYAVTANNQAGFNIMQHRILLTSDRLDNIGQPSAIPNWFEPNSPLVTVSATTPVALAEDQDFPTRIHWQDSKVYGRVAQQTGSATSVIAPTVTTTSLHGGANLRLKLRLSDEHGLFFHCCTRLNLITPSDQEFAGRYTILGTIYYRVRFG